MFNISFEEDAHSAALHSHLSSWALGVVAMKEGKRMKLMVVLVSVLVLLSGCGNSTNSDPQKALCKTSMMSFIRAHAMMYDEQGRIVQLNDEQTETMKGLIMTGIGTASGVSDTYLTSVHSELPTEFRDHLVKGWKLYLAGLDEANPSLQVQGIQLVEKWESYKEKHVDDLYHAIIE